MRLESDLEWHGTWPLFDADGWQRGLARRGMREDPDAASWIRFQDEHGIDLSVLYPTACLAAVASSFCFSASMNFSRSKFWS